MLELSRNLYKDRKIPNIVETVALFNKGIAEATDEIYKHKEFLIKTGLYTEHNEKRRELFFLKLLQEDIRENILQNIYKEDKKDLIEKIKHQEANPYEIVSGIIEDINFDLGRCHNLNF